MSRPDALGPRARTLIRSVLTAGGAQAGTLAVSFLVTPVLVGVLGFERYGMWALAGVLVNYIGLLDLGFGTSFVRFLARHHGRRDTGSFNAVMRLGMLFYGVFAVPVFGGVLLLRGPLLDLLAVDPVIRAEVGFLLVGVTAILLLRSLFVVFRAAIAAVERIDVNNRIALAVVLPNGVGAVLAVVLGFGLQGLVINGLATALITIVLQVRAAYRLVPSLRLRPFRLDWSQAPELASYGLRMQATRVAELLSGHVDKLILGLLIGAASVGVYELGMKLSLLAAAVPTMLLPVVLPTSSLLAARSDRSRLAELHARATRYVGWVLAPAAAYLLVCAPDLLSLWIGGPGLEPAAAATRLLILGTAPLLALGVSRLVARGVGLPQVEMWAHLLMAGLNVPLSILLVRRLGAIGAPLGTCCAGLAGGICFLLVFRRRIAIPYGLQPLRPLLVPIVVSTLAGLAALAAVQTRSLLDLPAGRTGALFPLAVAAVPFGLVYVAILARGMFLDEYDRQVVRETWQMARGTLGQTRAAR